MNLMWVSLVLLLGWSSTSLSCWQSCLMSSETSFLADLLEELNTLNLGSVGGTALVLDASVPEDNLDLFRVQRGLAQALAFGLLIDPESNVFFSGYYSHEPFSLSADIRADACKASLLIDSLSMVTNMDMDDYLGGVVSMFGDSFDDFADPTKNKLIVAIMNSPIDALMSYHIESYYENDVRVAIGINGNFNPEADINFPHPWPRADLEVVVSNATLSALVIEEAVNCMRTSCQCPNDMTN